VVVLLRYNRQISVTLPTPWNKSTTTTTTTTLSASARIPLEPHQPSLLLRRAQIGLRTGFPALWNRFRNERSAASVLSAPGVVPPSRFLSMSYPLFPSSEPTPHLYTIQPFRSLTLDESMRRPENAGLSKIRKKKATNSHSSLSLGYTSSENQQLTTGPTRDVHKATQIACLRNLL
jgi:hypothetical protein